MLKTESDVWSLLQANKDAPQENQKKYKNFYKSGKKKKYQEALICNPSSLGIRKTLIDKIYGYKAEKREKKT